MRNIPDIDPTAYGDESLRAMDLLRLSDAFEATQDLFNQVEAAAREIRKAIGPIPLRVRTPEQIADYESAARRLALATKIARSVRARFVEVLLATCDDKAYLGRSAAFRAAKDASGVQRIPLFNPPSPPAKPTVMPEPEGGFR